MRKCCAAQTEMPLLISNNDHNATGFFGVDAHTPWVREGRASADLSALPCPQTGGCSLARREEKDLSFSEPLP